jgi:predicted RNA-binding Zn ribbon-like protein
MQEVDVVPTDPALASRDGYQFELSGGHPALDFANTVSRRIAPEDDHERLTHYGRLVSWAEQAGLVTTRDGERLRTEAGARSRAAAAALRRAVALREAIFGVFVAIARGEPTPAAALDAVNAALPSAMAALRVSAERSGFAWRFAHDGTDLAPMLAPILRSAADLLTSGDLVRVRECGADTCFWLFLDGSKNGTRRWCDMKVCGNRAKARRHYQREKRVVKATKKTADHR